MRLIIETHYIFKDLWVPLVELWFWHLSYGVSFVPISWTYKTIWAQENVQIIQFKKTKTHSVLKKVYATFGVAHINTFKCIINLCGSTLLICPLTNSCYFPSFKLTLFTSQLSVRAQLCLHAVPQNQPINRLTKVHFDFKLLS